MFIVIAAPLVVLFQEILHGKMSLFVEGENFSQAGRVVGAVSLVIAFWFCRALLLGGPLFCIVVVVVR